MKLYKLPKIATAPFCPSEVEGTVYVDPYKSAWKRYLATAGIGLMVSVGYMDPGNWATDIQAGSQFGYQLLFVIFISNIFAIFLQAQCIKLGLGTGKDLAVICRENLPQKVNYFFWFLAEIAIIACDVAEVLGTALALQLLFKIKISSAIIWTAVDTLVVLGLQGKGVRRLEAIVLGLVATIGLCYFFEIYLSHPNWVEVGSGFIPSLNIIGNKEAWVIAIGILGATVMPHNLYLHSSLILTRRTENTNIAKKKLYHMSLFDNALSLSLAFFINAAILIVAAAVFYKQGYHNIVEIQDAHKLLTPLLGAGLAGTFFALALFAAGQSSTITGTIAGQVILEGFLKLKIPCWQRRMITRTLALIPAYVGVSILGEHSIGKMLIYSQVVLSLQLPFAIVPLMYFTGNKKIMKEWVNTKYLQCIGWIICFLVTAANIWMLIQLMS
ncbi:MAG: Nramp family divalent metal transporter [Bacteriovorax sp.]|nr:Nramp family divalent metal transporter [Bacteriovorax sp.]